MQLQQKTDLINGTKRPQQAKEHPPEKAIREKT